jgi:hypothetical protein
VRRQLTILTLLAILGIVPLLLLSGCNILGWTSGDYSGLGHLEKGKKLLRDGKYQEAEAELALAIEEDPYNSETRYYHAKALVLAADIEIMWLVDQVDQLESQREQIPLPIFTPDPEVTLEEDIVNKNTIYQANLGVREDLTWIIDRRATGRFKADDIVGDLAVATTLCALLSLRDSDQDGDIDEDDIILEIEPHDGVYEIKGLEQFLTGGLAKLGSGPHDPEQINVLIDSSLGLIAEARACLVYIIQKIQQQPDFDVMFYVAAVGELLDDVEATIKMYYYDDNIDNDGNNGADEETLDSIDNDQDGLTDEDTDHI